MNPIDIRNTLPNMLAPPSAIPSYRPPAFGGGPRAALDKLLQRELNVDDPTDAAQVARALMARYRDDPRTRALEQEAQGLPFLLPPSVPAPMLQPGTPATNVDLDQALADIDMDLRELIGSNLAKDIAPELAGWGQAIRAAVERGVSAARMGIDTLSRDTAFAVRRQLGDYARMARLVGVLTPALNADFRNLAQSLDEVAAVILVQMGEALANTGMAGGRYLLQVPCSELQMRRDVVINALRNLSGSTQEAFGPSDWPRGIDAFRQLYNMFEANGQGELRSLLSERELAAGMDDLIQLAANGAASGLRALGATAWAQLNRFVRFVQITARSVRPASPPLVAFQEALQMFVDGFTSSGGFRLLRIARPTILFYGLYGADEVSRADRRLLQLVISRGTIAGQLDCLTRCACDPGTVRAQIIGDRVLYDIDRAIDLYCVGNDDLGLPEVRASAYSFTVEQAAFLLDPPATPPPPIQVSRQHELAVVLQQTVDLLRPANNLLWESGSDYARAERLLRHWDRALLQELTLQQFGDNELRSIVEQMTSNCIRLHDVFDDCLGLLSDEAIDNAQTAILAAQKQQTRLSHPREFARYRLEMPPASESSLSDIDRTIRRMLDKDDDNNINDKGVDDSGNDDNPKPGGHGKKK